MSSSAPERSGFSAILRIRWCQTCHVNATDDKNCIHLIRAFLKYWMTGRNITQAILLIILSAFIRYTPNQKYLWAYLNLTRNKGWSCSRATGQMRLLAAHLHLLKSLIAWQHVIAPITELSKYKFNDRFGCPHNAMCVCVMIWGFISELTTCAICWKRGGPLWPSRHRRRQIVRTI